MSWWKRRESNSTSALKTLKLLILRMPENCRIPRLPGLRTNRVQRISGTPRIPAVASSDPFSGRSEVFSDLYTPVPFAMAGAWDSKSRSRVATMPFSLWNLTAKQRCIRNLQGFPSLSLFPNCPAQWTTFRKNLVSLVSLLPPMVQFGRERTGDAPLDSNATIPGPCWHRLRQCGRCTSKWHSGP
jgi:hypothetical protein